MRTVLLLIALAAAAAAAEVVAPDPLSLPEALRLAEQASPDIQLARLKALEAQAQARITAADLGPQLSLNAGMRYQTTNLGSIGLTQDTLGPFGTDQRIGPFRVFDARPRLTQMLLDLSRRATAQAAKLTAQAAEQNSQVVAEQTRYTVLHLYLQAQQSETRRLASEKRIASRKAIVDHAAKTYAEGTVDKLEVTRAQQAYERERLAAISAARDRDTMITMLLKAVGASNIRPVKLSPVDPPASTLEEDTVLLKESLAHRAELQVLRTEGQAAGAQLLSAQRERLPKVEGVGDFGVLGADPFSNVSTYLVGASVTIPLWTSRRIENNMQAAKIRQEQNAQQTRQVEQQITQEVAQALVERDAALKTLEVTGLRLESARETLKLVKMRVEAGLSTSVELTTAENEVAEAEEDRLIAQYDGWLANANLAHARGDSRLFLGKN